MYNTKMHARPTKWLSETDFSSFSALCLKKEKKDFEVNNLRRNNGLLIELHFGH